MSRFSFGDYQDVVEKAQSGGSSAAKIGFFKLKEDGEEALARINCSGLEALDFASVHTVQADGKWLKVSCLNPVGNYADTCPLCVAAAAGNTAISKASKKVYVQMMVSYRDPVTKQFAEPVPVIWERPAAFSRDLATKLRDYTDLRKVLLKITRMGKAGDMQTKYSLDYALPTVFKPELVPEDFSAFTNFNIAKHSYWEKTPEEIASFLASGKFPEIATTTKTTAAINTAPAAKANQAAKVAATEKVTPAAQTSTPTQVQPAAAPAQVAPATPAAPAQSAPTATEQPKTEAPSGRPARNFSGFSF